MYPELLKLGPITVYTYGVLLAGIVGPHEIFHLAVLAGVGCTWAFILSVAAGRHPAENAMGRADRRPRLPPGS